jgi:plastocyanin
MRTGRLCLLAALVAAVAALTVSASPQGARAADVTVSLGDSFFSPSSITVHVGDTITWSNDGALPHTTTAANAWDSDILMAGEQFSYTFATAGTFNYLCAVHPTLMTGTVVVEQASAGQQPAPTATTAPAAGQTPAGNPSADQNLPSAGTGPGPMGDGAAGQWAIIAGVTAVALASLGGAAMMLRTRRKP